MDASRAENLAADGDLRDGDSAGGGPTILVLDDEEGVRRLVRTMLERAGCRVLEGKDGEDGLRLVEERQGQLDVVLTDMSMPEIGGREVFEVLTRNLPGLPVIGMSGFAGVSGVPPDRNRPRLQILSKPFAADDLLGVVLETARQSRARSARAAEAKARALVEQGRALALQNRFSG